MKYFFPDSHDTVDPSFDFETEERSVERIRQRDDKYAHECFSKPPYDGFLISKGLVDGVVRGNAKYSLPQRIRLFRTGAGRFFRTGKLPVMGDCGAFSYVKNDYPPFTVEEVLEFYNDCDVDYGIAVDHVILAYRPDSQSVNKHRQRQEITLELASEFLNEHSKQKLNFMPVGVAQGWSPDSYARSVVKLQKIGYRYIAVGGLVSLKTEEILKCLEKISEIRRSETKLHLLGVTRINSIPLFAKLGVASFDSTSPLLQAFKDDRDNYHTFERTYSAIRVPQLNGNRNLQKKVRSGKISQDEARKLESESLGALRQFSSGKRSLKSTLDAIDEYDRFCNPRKNHRELYREVLEEKPWKSCRCEICQKLDYHVILFRGAQRNKRRGFHNLWVFHRRLQSVLEKK